MWDVISNEEALSQARHEIKTSWQSAAAALCVTARDAPSGDDITVLVCSLNIPQRLVTHREEEATASSAE